MIAALAIGACESSDDEDDRAAETEATPSETAMEYDVTGATCPPSFSLPRGAPPPGTIELVVATEDGSTGFRSTDTVDVECVGDLDNEPFPFEATDVEFTVGPDGDVDGQATWNDSVGLTMSALISGSADEALSEIKLELTAPNGDVLSEMTLSGG